MFDFRFNTCWQQSSLHDEPIERRGGVLYRNPAGWRRFALNIKGKYDGGDDTWMGMEGVPGEWAVAYHGTAMCVVPLIVKNGFKPGKGQGAKLCFDTRTGEKCGSGIFCTPSLKTVECYANGGEDGGSDNQAPAAEVDGHTLFFALQCRVKPEAIRRPDRHFARCNDEEVMGIDGVFEWVISNPDHIRPYAILVRDKDGADHRHLADLINKLPNQKWAWNVRNKPLPWGSFDHIPGRLCDVEEIKHSYLHALRALN